MFGFGWEEGTATVVARRLLKEFYSSRGDRGGVMRRRKFEFILDVRPPDGSPRFRATCKSSSHDPVQGDEVPVKYKPKSQKVRFQTSRTLGPRRRNPQPEDDRWRDMLDDEPGSVPPPRNDG